MSPENVTFSLNIILGLLGEMSSGTTSHSKSHTFNQSSVKVIINHHFIHYEITHKAEIDKAPSLPLPISWGKPCTVVLL